MGYFSNGTEGEIYEEFYCAKCAHYKEGACPVLAAHMLYQYELCNEKEHPGKVILDLLIPIKDGHNRRCAMFVSPRRVEPPTEDRQTALFPVVS